MKISLSGKICFVCLFFVIGIFIESYFCAGIYLPVFFLIFFSLFVVSFSLGRSNALINLFLLCSLSVSLGCFWYNFNSSTTINQSIIETKELTGTVVNSPEKRELNTQIVLLIDDFNNEKILLTTERQTSFNYGDVLHVKGNFSVPKKFDNFDYPKYLAKDGISYISFYPSIEKIQEKKSFFKSILTIKEESRKKIDRNIPAPNSFILSAIILGDKQSIPKDWQQKLSSAGVRHITAVSGLHVTVVSIILISLFFGLGINRRNSFLISILGVAFFVSITGFQSSAIRAGIMGSCLLVGKIFGRMNGSGRLILLAASLMLLQNPLILKHDIGFQLSFLAVIGITSFSGFWNNFLYFLPKFIREIASMSLSAYLFTLPLVLYYFSEASLVFIFANILIVPALYLMMLTALGFLLFSFVSPFLVFFWTVPLWMITTYIVFIVDLFSSFEHSSFIFQVSSIWVLFFYLAIFIFIFLTRKEKREDSDPIYF